MKIEVEPLGFGTSLKGVIENKMETTIVCWGYI